MTNQVSLPKLRRDRRSLQIGEASEIRGDNRLSRAAGGENTACPILTFPGNMGVEVLLLERLCSVAPFQTGTEGVMVVCVAPALVYCAVQRMTSW